MTSNFPSTPCRYEVATNSIRSATPWRTALAPATTSASLEMSDAMNRHSGTSHANAIATQPLPVPISAIRA